jgi:hypothetical protein
MDKGAEDSLNTDAAEVSGVEGGAGLGETLTSESVAKLQVHLRKYPPRSRKNQSSADRPIFQLQGYLAHKKTPTPLGPF